MTNGGGSMDIMRKAKKNAYFLLQHSDVRFFSRLSRLVSGLWGIFYFHEIEGTDTIAKWFTSASVTVLGILLLSFEHHEK
jgi:hypothetical protein